MNAPMGTEQSPRADAAGPRRPRMRWVHAATDRVPTSWLTGIATVAFLAATAAFGGLNDPTEPPLPTLAVGDEHRNAQLSIAVERAVLLDEFPEAGIEVQLGERVLALVVMAENLWTQPLLTTGDHSVSQALRVPSLGDVRPAAVARYDDSTTSPILQPGVPARLVVTWAIDADAFVDGGELPVDLRDATLYTGQLIIDGQSWNDPVTAAHLAVPLDDLGAGADAESAR